MKQKIIFISFSILFLLLFAIASFAKNIEKDNSVKKQVTKVDKKEQTVQKTDVNSKENTTKSDTQTKTMIDENKSQTLTEYLPLTSSTLTGEQINWQVLSSGGNRGTSTNYILSGTLGQTAVGIGTSTNFQLHAGFWQNFGSGGCCIGDRGNANGSPDDGTIVGSVNVTDLVFFVAYSFQDGPAPPCPEEADVNGSGDINVADLIYLAAFIFQDGPPPLPCP